MQLEYLNNACDVLSATLVDVRSAVARVVDLIAYASVTVRCFCHSDGSLLSSGSLSSLHTVDVEHRKNNTKKQQRPNDDACLGALA